MLTVSTNYSGAPINVFCFGRPPIDAVPANVADGSLTENGLGVTPKQRVECCNVDQAFRKLGF